MLPRSGAGRKREVQDMLKTFARKYSGPLGHYKEVSAAVPLKLVYETDQTYKFNASISGRIDQLRAKDSREKTVGHA